MVGNIKSLMVQGTSSNVGKSLFVAGLCRIFSDMGYKVAPFKAQNMSNNSAVAVGGEIGRAQSLQAFAARVEANIDMNPVLLKPLGDSRSELILLGKAAGIIDSGDWRHMRDRYLSKVHEAFFRLSSKFDIVFVEGAGSPAEVNLREGDIANMGFALPLKVKVILLADVEKGGSIASIIGCLACLSPEERDLIKGYAFNKFRGSIDLFDGAINYLKEKIEPECLGVMPWLEALETLPAEDSQAINISSSKAFGGKKSSQKPKLGAISNIGILRLPSISNFEEFQILKQYGFTLNYLSLQKTIPDDVDFLIIPGSKNVIRDVEALHANNWRYELSRHLGQGNKIWGICGGYIMLCNSISDPLGLEGQGTATKRLGMGLINAEATLQKEKVVKNATGTLQEGGEKIKGYRIHRATIKHLDSHKHLLVNQEQKNEGYVSKSGAVIASFWHGLAENKAFTNYLTGKIIDKDVLSTDRVIDMLAKSMLENIDIDFIKKTINL